MTVERAQVISRKCWRCKEPVGGPVCSSCSAIQPPTPDADFYDLLGIPRKYFFENAVLEKAYRALSRKVHPDRFARKSAVERRMSLQWTATLNEARRVLKDPIRRARYLATGKAEAPEEGGPVMDPDFMEQVFDLQMAARAEPASVKAAATAMRTSTWAAVEETLRGWEASAGSLEAIPALLAQLKYIDNIVSLAASADQG